MQLALTFLLLGVYFLVRDRAPLIAGPVFAAVFLALAPGTPVGGGVGWAAGCLVLTALGYAAALAVPVTRRLFSDPRYRMTPGRALFTALVAVPLSTVAAEEAAFRGALWPIAGLTPVLFGLWHVLPGTRTNAAAPHRWTTFAVTAAAGVVLALLRHFSGGLLAPFVLHWAVNGLGVLASAVAARLHRDGG